MPPFETKDPLAEAIKDQQLGRMGIHTGSLANRLGLDERERDRARSPSIGADGSGAIAVVVLLAIGAWWVYDRTASWWAVGGAGVALVLAVLAIRRFLATPLGQFVVRVTQVSLALAMIAGMVWLYVNWRTLF